MEKQKGNHRHKESKRERQAALSALKDARIFWEQCGFNVTIRLIEKLRSWTF